MLSPFQKITVAANFLINDVVVFLPIIIYFEFFLHIGILNFITWDK